MGLGISVFVYSLLIEKISDCFSECMQLWKNLPSGASIALFVHYKLSSVDNKKKKSDGS